jgi:hypothetical protein
MTRPAQQTLMDFIRDEQACLRVLYLENEYWLSLWSSNRPERHLLALETAPNYEQACFLVCQKLREQNLL